MLTTNIVSLIGLAITLGVLLLALSLSGKYGFGCAVMCSNAITLVAWHTEIGPPWLVGPVFWIFAAVMLLWTCLSGYDLISEYRRKAAGLSPTPVGPWGTFLLTGAVAVAVLFQAELFLPAWSDANGATLVGAGIAASIILVNALPALYRGFRPLTDSGSKS
jgi:hypothetical protein